MLIALCADKGSPGVTTTALALASSWSTPAVVVETDPAGGDLAIRIRHGGSALPEAPTLLTVAAAARNHRDKDLLSRYAQPVNPRLSVIPGPILAEQLAGVRDWEPLVDALAHSVVPVLVDLGHLHSGSQMLAFAARADVMVVVGRSDATSVIRMRERLDRLAAEVGAMRGSPTLLFPLLVTTDRHGPALARDMRTILDQTSAKPFLVGSGYLALDPAAVRRLETGEDPGGRLARTALMRSARAVVSTIEQSTGGTGSAAVESKVGGGLR